MATTQAVKQALKVLAVNFAGDVTPEKVKLWHEALKDVSDEALSAAVPKIIREHTGAFIPPVGLIREVAGANVKPVLDTDAMLRRIAALGSHNPNVGWSPPRMDVVRRAFGDAVGDAYVAAGPDRLYAQSDTTRDIATRDFGKVLNEIVAQRGVECLSPTPTAPVLPQVKRLAGSMGRSL